MVYYRLRPDIYSPYDVVGDPALPVGISFLAGRPITAALQEPLVFRVNHAEGEQPKHLLGASIPVASPLFVQALQRAGVDNFQTFPAVLRHEATNREWPGYLAFNAIGLIDALDSTGSSGEVIMPGDDLVPPLMDFDEVVLIEAKTMGLLMFRLVQSPGDLFVRDTVKDQLLAMKPAEGWGITSFKVEVR